MGSSVLGTGMAVGKLVGAREDPSAGKQLVLVVLSCKKPCKHAQ